VFLENRYTLVRNQQNNLPFDTIQVVDENRAYILRVSIVDDREGSTGQAARERTTFVTGTLTRVEV
jgi:hypothetical protein